MQPATRSPDHSTLTWSELVTLEPRLADLLRAARTAKPRGSTFCRLLCFYGFGSYRGFKPRLVKLVGWHRQSAGNEADDRRLYGVEAYHLTYQTILDALPDCHGDCGCVR